MLATLIAQTTDGELVAARTAGISGESIVFVHGLLSTAAIWRAQLEALSDSYRCTAVELRGNAQSNFEVRPEKITREGFVADVLAVADAARARRFHFVGCGLGGAIGFELWKRAPLRIATMTLVGTFAAYPGGLAQADAIVAQLLEAGSTAAYARQRADAMGLQPGKRRDETIEQISAKSVPGYIAGTQATWTSDYRSLLPRIAVPTFVMVGERDEITPPTLAKEIADGIPDARFGIVPGAGHIANADNPPAFDAMLHGFLRDHAGATA